MIARRFSLLAATGLLALSACTSEPSTKTVAEEIVETLEGVSQEVKDCMTEKLQGYSDEDLESIGDDNEDFSSVTPDMAMTPELEAFIADLAECNDGGAPGGTATDGTASDETGPDEPSGGTAPATTQG